MARVSKISKPKRPARSRARRPELSPRKEPSQERARHTVDAILEAAGDVLVREGFDRASTNRIADAAGVSIGSLYQYFPNKDAVVRALVERHEARMLEVMRTHLGDLAGKDVREVTRALIEGLLDAHRVKPKLQKVLLEHGGHEASSVDAAVEALVRAAVESRRIELAVNDVDVAAFLLVTAVRTACHRAVVERPDLLERPAFVDELCDLVLRYIAADAPAAPRSTTKRG